MVVGDPQNAIKDHSETHILNQLNNFPLVIGVQATTTTIRGTSST